MQVKSARELETLFARLLKKPVSECKFFEFSEEEDWVIACQPRNVYLEKDDWMKVYNYCRDADGKAERDEKTGQWLFRFPRASAPKPYAAAKQRPEPREADASDQIIKYWKKDYEKSVEKSSESERAELLRVNHVTIPVDALLSMPFQSRISEDPEMEELVESVKTYGVLEPILVREKPSGLYEVVAGERRLTAAKEAGLVEVPAIVKPLTDEEAFVLQLTENFQRKDLTEEEKNRALAELARRTGWNAKQIADKLKMSYTWVVKYLPSEFKVDFRAEAGRLGGEARAQEFATRRVANGDVTPSHGWIKCDGCGTLTKGELDGEGKVYCSLCREKAGIEPRVQIPAQEEAAPTPAAEPEASEAPIQEATKPESLYTAIEWRCTECHQKIVIPHIDHPDGKISHEIMRWRKGGE